MKLDEEGKIKETLEMQKRYFESQVKYCYIIIGDGNK